MVEFVIINKRENTNYIYKDRNKDFILNNPEDIYMKLPPVEKKRVVLPYPETTMFGAVLDAANRFPKAPALEFMGSYTTYTQLIKKIEQAATAFYAAGIRKNAPCHRWHHFP